MLMGQPTLGMGQGQPVQERRDLVIGLGPDDEVPMVGHQAVAQQAQGATLLGFNQHAQKGSVVTVLAEQGGTSVGPVQDVVDVAAWTASQRSSHVPEATRCQTSRQPVTGSKCEDCVKRLLTPFLVRTNPGRGCGV